MTFAFMQEIQTFIYETAFYIKPWSEVLGIIWCVNIINWIIGSRLNVLGINPRHPFGLVGIFCSPFLHRDFAHLLFNTVPLFVLGLALLASGGAVTFCWITLVIAVLGGLAVWLFARPGMHIGASGVISGYFGYILMTAYKQPGVITILLAILAVYYFGGIFSGIFPKEKQTSWESHLFGFISGIVCVFIPNGFVYFHLAV